MNDHILKSLKIILRILFIIWCKEIRVLNWIFSFIFLDSFSSFLLTTNSLLPHQMHLKWYIFEEFYVILYVNTFRRLYDKIVRHIQWGSIYIFTLRERPLFVKYQFIVLQTNIVVKDLFWLTYRGCSGDVNSPEIIAVTMLFHSFYFLIKWALDRCPTNKPLTLCVPTCRLFFLFSIQSSSFIHSTVLINVDKST